MSEIVLQFCSFHSFLGRAIPWFTQGKIGHVDAVLPSGGLLGAQASCKFGTLSGVQVRAEGYGEMHSRVRVYLPCSAQEYELWLDFLYFQLGKPYDVIAIAAFVTGRDWRDPSAWFCSELQAAGLEECGVFPKLYTPANKVTPNALLLACSVLARQVEELEDLR